MKRFNRLRTILWITILGFGILSKGYEHIFANTELTVKQKEDQTIYVNETITTDRFEFQLGNKSICDFETIEMSPCSFSDIGEQYITFTYKEENVAYMKKIMVNVQPVEASFLSVKKDTISLIQGQEVTKEQLPEIYLHYNNGEQKLIEEYAFFVDWEKKKVYIFYDHFSTELTIDVIENKMDYLEIIPYVKEVPENYVFDVTDIMVILHYTNGTKEKVTDYQIMPYKLMEGCESSIYVTYKEITGKFKVKATKKIEEATPLPTTSPVVQLPEVSISEPQPTVVVEDKLETPEPESTDISENGNIAEPESTDISENGNTPEPELTDISENGNTPEPEQTKDTTPPKTSIKEKTYKKDLKISATDESGIESIVLRGSMNKTIKNGYKLTKEGSYQLILTDIYGNVKTVKFKLEKTVKKIKVSYSFTDKWNVIKFQARAIGTSRSVQWSVSNEKVATIDKNGTFKVKKSGTVYLVAKLDKKKVKQKIKIEKKKKSILLY